MSATLEASYIPELEQEVLGALLLSGEVKHVPGSLEPGHFIEPFHRDLFASMKQAAEQYSSVRLDLVRNVLAAAGDMDAIGKQLGIPVPEYLARLVGGTVRGAAGLKDSIPAMLHQWARFTVGREAERLLLASADPGTSPVELIRTAAHAFDDVSSTLRRGRQRKTLVSIGEASESAIAAVSEAMKHGAGLTGTTWGLADINRATGGMQAGEMIILGARPSMGKTAVALSIAIQAAKAGAGVGFISLEMAARSLALRALTDIAFDDNGRIAYSDLLTGRARRPRATQTGCAPADDRGRFRAFHVGYPRQGRSDGGECREGRHAAQGAGRGLSPAHCRILALSGQPHGGNHRDIGRPAQSRQGIQCGGAGAIAVVAPGRKPGRQAPDALRSTGKRLDRAGRRYRRFPVP
jgi:hypothetical protein